MFRTPLLFEARFGIVFESDEGMPVGYIHCFPLDGEIPENVLLADGRSVRKDEYRKLYDTVCAIEGRWPWGEDENTFVLPDLRYNKIQVTG